MPLSRNRFIVSSFAAWSCTLGPAIVRAQTPPSDLVVADPDVFPESLAYDATTQKFYVGSLRNGRLTSVDASGAATPFSATDPAYSSIFGVFIDPRRGIVYACATNVGLGAASDPATVGRVCKLVGFDTRSGRIVRDVDLIDSLPGKHLPNDGALAADGTIYVTDTTAPIVFRVSSDGRSEAFVRDEGFAPPTGPGGGIDGIAIASTGTIVVNHFTNGTFFRIDPGSRAVKRVAIAGDRTLPGADGMRLRPDGTLVVAQSTLAGPKARNAIVLLTTTDDWNTADVASELVTTRTTYQTVTTASGAYGIQGDLEDFFKDPKSARAPSFTIARLPDAAR